MKVSVIAALLAVCSAVVLEQPEAASDVMINHDEADEGLYDDEEEDIELAEEPKFEILNVAPENEEKVELEEEEFEDSLPEIEDVQIEAEEEFVADESNVLVDADAEEEFEADESNVLIEADAEVEESEDVQPEFEEVQVEEFNPEDTEDNFVEVDEEAEENADEDQEAAGDEEFAFNRRKGTTGN